MTDPTTTQDVFRYIQLGPGAAAKGKTQPELRRTPSYEKLEQLDPQARLSESAIALQHSKLPVSQISQLTHGAEIQQAIKATVEADEPTVQTLTTHVAGKTVGGKKFEHDANLLSDTLLYAAIAPHAAPAAIESLAQVYSGYWTLISFGEGKLDGEASILPIVTARAFPGFFMATASVRSVGVADLLVVKQHIKAYEMTEIAHVENIMTGETRSREHRHLERYEEIVTQESETTTEQEEELESTERFELESETSRTIKEDQKYSFDLSVSGQYGPVVEFGTNLGIEVERSEETKARNATKYAKEVVQRSLDRVKERVRSSRVRKIVRETEERNLHSFVNDDAEGVSGVYQFLEKVYEAQVFNYGKRQMFDLLIPEPASYIWHLKGDSEERSASLPAPPDPIEISASELLHTSADSTHAQHFLQLAKKYGATGIKAPPPQHMAGTVKYIHPQGMESDGGGSEAGDLSAPPAVLEIKIPTGYIPVDCKVSAIAMTNDINGVRIGVATTHAYEIIDGSVREHIGGNPTEGQLYLVRGDQSLTFTFTDETEFESEGKVAISLMPFQTTNHTVLCHATFKLAAGALESWRIQTFDAIMSAYKDRVLEHKDEVSRVLANLRQEDQEDKEKERQVGLPPSQRRQVILAELKKHCISIFRQQHFGDPTPMRVGGSAPTFDFEVARQRGELIRFLEHAFEWSQLQYAFYPYFWSSSWDRRFEEDDPDYEFQQFLQAGSARVVVSVRPGFERAVSYFLERKIPFQGAGEPIVTDPLYLPIVDELRERSDIVDAIPVGEPWDVRMPTSLIMLRSPPGLPKWARSSDKDWEWEQVE